MSADPFQTFLGIPETADPSILLGLPQSQLDPVRIDASLRARLGRIYRHPEGRSADAEMVRQALRAAAERLKAVGAGDPNAPDGSHLRSRRREFHPSQPALRLTDFDRMVLAVLVANGGWNRASRDQLVAVACEYDVSVQGLMRVVQGLTAYARAGGPRIGVADITSGQRMMPKAHSPGLPGIPAGSAILDRLTSNLADELRRNDPWSTIKLSLIFGVVTIIAGIIGVRLLIQSSTQEQQASAKPEATLNVPSAPNQPVAKTAGGEASRVATFPRIPTFLGNGLPMAAVNAADQCPALASQIDDLARRLSINAEPPDALYRNWDLDIQTIAMGWPLADASSRHAIEKAVFDALRAAADTPTVSDRMLKSFSPPASISDALDLWRGAWFAGMLGKMASSNSLPAVVVERARTLLHVAEKGQPSATSSTFELAAGGWLDMRVPQLVADLEFDDHAYDKWELWITAQRSLGIDDRHTRSIMSALSAILQTQTDLSRPGPSVNVAARLLNVALDHPTESGRAALAAIFDSEKVSTRDLWVLTSLMARSDQATWFKETYIVPEEADQMHRWRLRDDITKAWPAATLASAAATVPAIPPVDARVGRRWAATLDELLRQPVSRDRQVAIKQLLAASRLVEAAQALAGQNPVAADQLVDATNALLAQTGSTSAANAPEPLVAAAPGTPPPGPSPNTTLSQGKGKRAVPSAPSRTGRPPGQALGRDGEWSAAYVLLKKAEERMDAMRGLRTTAGTDLGPIDAEVFVREVYRASPPELRSVAQSVASGQFDSGPNIAMEMLDQFPDSPTNDAISSCIEGLTGKTLPGVRSTGWAAEARTALVVHALSLRPEGMDDMDELTEALIDCHARRLAMLKHEAAPSVVPLTPQAAAALELQAWIDKASLTMTDAPYPDDLAGLQRRHGTRMRLAEGPIQNFVAQQLGILDLLTYVTVAEQPENSDAVRAALRKSADQRSGASGVLEQAVQIERATARLWQLRLRVNMSPAVDGTAAETGSTS